MQRLIDLLLPALVLALCVYRLAAELVIRRLQLHGAEATAVVVTVNHTVAVGLRSLLATIAKKPEKERQFGCDYILTLRFPLQSGGDTTVQTAVPARMKLAGGERLPYFMEGDSIPIRYDERHPKRLVVMLDAVVRRQGRLLWPVLWGVSAAIMLAVCITIFAMP